MFHKDQFKKELVEDIKNRWLVEVEDVNEEMLRTSLANVIQKLCISDNWINSKKDTSRKVHYFSMEFMIGKQLKTNLVNLDILHLVKEGLSELGIDLEKIFNTEIESKTANGGLGRLAFAIMNGTANIDINACGNGLLYREGIFEQHFIDGRQIEVQDFWFNSEGSYEWKYVQPQLSKVCKLYGEVKVVFENGKLKFKLENYTPVEGIVHEIPIVGFQNTRINTLRLFESRGLSNQKLKDLGLCDFIRNSEINNRYHSHCKQITDVLYPRDDHHEGKLLRMKQEYFCATIGLQNIIDEHMMKHNDIKSFHRYNVLHINDTHMSWVVPELMRILIDEFDLDWDDAWHITQNSITYTNHTVLQEALEKWDIHMVQSLLPRIYMIIEEINKRQNETYDKAIIRDNMIITANMLVETAYSVNGVAEIHSEIIKKETFKEFNHKFPTKFKNCTNGIEGRKWLLCDGMELSTLIEELIGNEWKYDFRKLKEFEKYASNQWVQEEFAKIKLKYKKELAEYIKETKGIEVDPNAMFLSHTKRLHAYKRQSMVILGILDLYHELINNPDKDVVPKVFIFGAKSASGYHFAKCVIKVINEVANMINNDTRIGNKLKVVFLENYNVTVAEKIIKGTDVSIQCPTAGQEASGTGNMKYMMLGALTHATLDGANVEINDLVGNENMYLFGLRLNEVEQLNQQGYNAWYTYSYDWRIKRVFDDLVNGFIPNIYFEGRTVFNEILNNDVYYVTKDLPMYLESMNRIDEDWKNPYIWRKKGIINVANSGFFDIVRNIEDYCDKVWNI